MWKAKLKKWFPKNKDLSEKQLLKQRRGFSIMQLLAISSMIIFSFAIGSVPKTLTVFQQIALDGVFIGVVSLSLSLYMQYQIFVTEINFELRLREALETNKSS